MLCCLGVRVSHRALENPVLAFERFSCSSCACRRLVFFNQTLVFLFLGFLNPLGPTLGFSRAIPRVFSARPSGCLLGLTLKFSRPDPWVFFRPDPWVFLTRPSGFLGQNLCFFSGVSWPVPGGFLGPSIGVFSARPSGFSRHDSRFFRGLLGC